MVTKNGKIKRTPLSVFKNVRKNGLRAISLDDGDEIAGVRMTDGSAQLIIATRNGYAIRIEENTNSANVKNCTRSKGNKAPRRRLCGFNGESSVRERHFLRSATRATADVRSLIPTVFSEEAGMVFITIRFRRRKDMSAE
jgi:DNA gyrase/topoisomerase IV subunit A